MPEPAPGTDGERAALLAGRVVLRAADARWPERFEALRGRLIAAAGPCLVAVEHIGSTSVPALEAKPVLDVIPVLRGPDDAPRLVDALAPLGYEYRGAFGIAGRHYLVRVVEGDAAVWKHHLHAYPDGHVEIRRHLVFRDALRAHPALRAEYAALKRALAARHPDDVEAYADGKGAFVERVIAAHGGPPRP